MTLREPIDRTRERLTEMTTELRHTGGRPGAYTLSVAGQVPALLAEVEGQRRVIADQEERLTAQANLIRQLRREPAPLAIDLSVTGRCGVCGEPVAVGANGWMHSDPRAASHNIDGVTVNEREPADVDLVPQTVAVVGPHGTAVLDERTGTWTEVDPAPVCHRCGTAGCLKDREIDLDWTPAPLPPLDPTVVREHPGTGQPMTATVHPADGTTSPELSSEWVEGGPTTSALRVGHLDCDPPHATDGTPELTGEQVHHARTSHGHPCCGKAPSERPNAIARCGGVGMCKVCGAERDDMHSLAVVEMVPAPDDEGWPAAPSSEQGGATA